MVPDSIPGGPAISFVVIGSLGAHTQKFNGSNHDARTITATHTHFSFLIVRGRIP